MQVSFKVISICVCHYSLFGAIFDRLLEMIPSLMGFE